MAITIVGVCVPQQVDAAFGTYCFQVKYRNAKGSFTKDIPKSSLKKYTVYIDNSYRCYVYSGKSTYVDGKRYYIMQRLEYYDGLYYIDSSTYWDGVELKPVTTAFSTSKQYVVGTGYVGTSLVPNHKYSPNANVYNASGSCVLDAADVREVKTIWRLGLISG